MMRGLLAVVLMAELCIVFGNGNGHGDGHGHGHGHHQMCTVCRPGACPKSGGKLPSTSGCSCDCDCSGKMKCCEYGSIRTCVQPASGSPGPCPVITTSARTCTVDKNCPAGWKCYSSGCGRLCAPAGNGA